MSADSQGQRPIATAYRQVAVGAVAQSLLLRTGGVGRLLGRPLGTILKLFSERIERVDAGAGCRGLLRLLSWATAGAISRVSKSRGDVGGRNRTVRGLDVARRSWQSRALLLLGRLEQKRHVYRGALEARRRSEGDSGRGRH